MGRPRRADMTLPPHVHRTVSRGRAYYSYWPFRGTKQAGKRVSLPGTPQNPDGTPNAAWWAAYRAASDTPAPSARAGSVEALILAYTAAPEWTSLSDGTRRNWSLHLKRIGAAWGSLDVRAIEPRHVLALRDKFAATPATANNVLRCLSSLMGWSVPRGWRSDNPCRDVPKLKGGEGYEPWPVEVIQATRAELPPHFWRVVAVALYTGQRLGDCLAMKWSALREGEVFVKQEKTGKALLIPLHRDLRAVLNDMPRSAVTILTNSDGRPWTVDGFQSSWNKAKPKTVAEGGFVFHGLRKSACVALFEAGCTEAEVASITGQSRKMLEHYSKGINQARMARVAMAKLEARENEK